MDAPTAEVAPPPPARSDAAPPDPRQTELVLAALHAALAEPREHRLFQSGKLPGLFPGRTGAPAAAALYAIQHGLLETVRTDVKGRLVVEWVKATPNAVDYVHQHDSPKAVLRDLQLVIGNTRSGIPDWMTEVRHELNTLSARFEQRSKELVDRLDELTRRVEAAIRRAEANGPRLSGALTAVVPWGVEALEHLDRRADVGGSLECPLDELFHALRRTHPDLTIPDFHDGLRRLSDNRAVRLCRGESATCGAEFAIPVGVELCHSVRR